MMKRMLKSVGVLAMLGAAMSGCESKDAPKRTAPPHPTAQGASAPTPDAAPAKSAEPVKTDASAPPTTPSGDEGEVDEELPPEEAIKQPGADPGWPAPGAKPVEVSRSAKGAVLEDYVVGEGMPTLPGAAITVHYVARVQGGAMFDSTYGNKRPRSTTTAGLMPALQDGIIGMRKGGKRRVILKPELAYGERGLKNAKGEEIVPPGGTVIFDLELVDLKQTFGAPAGAGTGGGDAPKP